MPNKEREPKKERERGGEMPNIEIKSRWISIKM